MRIRALSTVFALAALSLSSIAGAKAPSGPAFDRDAAAKALGGVELIKCKAPGGPRGAGHVLITFATDGTVSDVQVDRLPYKDNPVARCLASQYKQAKVPAFTGVPVVVGKNFSID